MTKPTLLIVCATLISMANSCRPSIEELNTVSGTVLQMGSPLAGVSIHIDQSPWGSCKSLITEILRRHSGTSTGSVSSRSPHQKQPQTLGKWFELETPQLAITDDQGRFSATPTIDYSDSKPGADPSDYISVCLVVNRDQLYWTSVDTTFDYGTPGHLSITCDLTNKYLCLPEQDYFYEARSD